MKYISIDVETTGLDASRDQILEVSMIIDNGEATLQECKQFHAYVGWKRLKGDPFALAMNAGIIKKIISDESIPPNDLIANIEHWLDRNGISKFTAAGKNFGSFDRQFLLNHPGGFSLMKRIHYRSLDPTLLYVIPQDERLPSLAECLKRADMEPTNLQLETPGMLFD